MTNAHRQTSRASMDDILSSIRRIIDESVTTDGEPTPKTVSPLSNSRPAPPRPTELLNRPPVAPAPVVTKAVETEPLDQRTDKPTHDSRFTPDDAEAFREVAEVLQSTASILHTRDVQPEENHPSVETDPEVEDVLTEIEASAEMPEAEAEDEADKVRPALLEDEKNTASVSPVAAAIAEPLKDQIVPLVSTATSRSIAQTLASLDQVLKERTGEDLKAMTEDMLKPLLAEWLDENLPAMVERLVRQEIERIARGEPRAA